MSKTLTELTTQIEELEKRIRAISSAQTSLSQILAIRDCIDQIKIYLEDLNSTLSNIEDSASDSELNELKARVSICEEDISAIQTDLATTQDDLSALRSDLNSTNTTVGEHTTTITNLQTTQTNLQTTQSSQASTINNINSRLTSCENNVNSLSGGVDISDYEARLTELENSLARPLYRINILFRKTVNSSTVAEVLFNFYTHEKLTSISEIYPKLPQYELPATGFYYKQLVYGVARTGGTELAVSVIKLTITDGAVESFTVSVNGKVDYASELWQTFIDIQEV